MKPYLLVTWGDVHPELLGPFGSEEARDQKAAEIRAANEEDGVYKLSAEGPVSIELYTGFEMDDLIEQRATTDPS